MKSKETITQFEALTPEQQEIALKIAKVLSQTEAEALINGPQIAKDGKAIVDLTSIHGQAAQKVLSTLFPGHRKPEVFYVSPFEKRAGLSAGILPFDSQGRIGLTRVIQKEIGKGSTQPKWAAPGGFVFLQNEESVSDAVTRNCERKIGLTPNPDKFSNHKFYGALSYGYDMTHETNNAGLALRTPYHMDDSEIEQLAQSETHEATFVTWEEFVELYQTGETTFREEEVAAIEEMYQDVQTVLSQSAS